MANSSIDQNSVTLALDSLMDPETGRSVVQMEQLKDVVVEGDNVCVSLGLTSWAGPVADEFHAEAVAHLKSALPDADKVTIEIVDHVRPAEKIGEIGLTAKSVIAVGSGKGGVGKSTVAASLAYALAGSHAKVGLMDADVYGPSLPHLMGVDERPQAIENRLQPIIKDNIRLMSMGFLVPPGEAVVWRGPMLHGAITQFLRDTDWGDLDYLIIDMPPGTGDIALTLSQLIPLTGSVVVCTPQDVALIDAVKAIAMFRKVNIPILGIVENMSYFVCPDTGKRYDIFGHGGAKLKAEELNAPFLGEVPINIDIRRRGDAGETSGNLTDEESAQYFQGICKNLVRSLVAKRTAEPPMPSLSVL